MTQHPPHQKLFNKTSSPKLLKMKEFLEYNFFMCV